MRSHEETGLLNPLLLSLISFALTACVTNSDTATAKKTIIDRSPGFDATPQWVSAPNKFEAGDNKVGFKGHLTKDSDSRGDACTHAAGIDAKGKIATLIATSVLDESGISGDDKNIVLNRLTATFSKQKLAHVEVTNEYWNLVEIDDGEKPVRRLECFAQVTMDKAVLDKLIERSIAEITADPKLSGFKDQILKAEKKLEDEG